ncbi:head maturation protease, ClpP-related [uncultured Microbacterium sp.]|uniref:head maturation protease, ClpP-related n=1 Tax=uncultured Microbacterium sp. TaxID=191216 RepID=UPI0025EB18DB|nr:head maturation protease, ClpP-related [uncultured Microbacterium sp.]
MNKPAENRYWGSQALPKSKTEFFNAVTTPGGSGDSTIATIRLYGPIDSWGGYWGVSAQDVGEVLDALPGTVDQIVLRINSGGGEVFEGVSILNMLRAHRASVTAVVDGRAASAASVIAAGCDEVVMSPGTQMMIHSPSVIAWGNAAEMRKTADILDGVEASIIEIYQAKAGDKDWSQLLADETWMTAAQAVEQGLADRVAVVPDAGETATAGADPDLESDPEDPEPLDSSPMLPRSSEPGSTKNKETITMSDTFLAQVRDRLGVTDANATEQTVLDALDESLAEAIDETPAPVATAVPEGTVVMDKEQHAQLVRDAQAGRDARDQQIKDRRDLIVAKAIETGRIAPANAESWRKQLDKDEDGVAALIQDLQATVPLGEIGHSDGVTNSDDANYEAIYGPKGA